MDRTVRPRGNNDIIEKWKLFGVYEQSDISLPDDRQHVPVKGDQITSIEDTSGGVRDSGARWHRSFWHSLPLLCPPSLPSLISRGLRSGPLEPNYEVWGRCKMPWWGLVGNLVDCFSGKLLKLLPPDARF